MIRWIKRTFRIRRGGSWHWHKPMSDGNCSAWASWLVAIQFPPFSLGIIRETWGVRICLTWWQLVYHEPDNRKTTTDNKEN